MPSASARAPADPGRLGFGCAGIFRLPRRADRQALLDAAYDAGIRHFDVAPIYGLGRAETELAVLLGRRRDEVAVTTKFGIDVTAVGRLAGRLQGPVRAALARRPNLQAGVALSGRGPSSGALGRALYTAPGYSASTAHRSLHRSLRALGTTYVDGLALHDPGGGVLTALPDLIEELESQQRSGRIRCWGVAGELPPPGSAAASLLERAGFVQFRDDVFDRPGRLPATGGLLVTYGSLSRALTVVRRYVGEAPEAVQAWGDRLSIDPTSGADVAGLLLRTAVHRNPTGVTVFSTTRADRIRWAVAATSAPLAEDEVTALDELLAVIPARLVPTVAR